MFKRLIIVQKVATFLKNVAAFTTIVADTAQYFIKRMDEAFPSIVIPDKTPPDESKSQEVD